MDIFDFHNFQICKTDAALEVTDLDYSTFIGKVTYEPGPGAIFTPAGKSFLDAGQTRSLADLLQRVNTARSLKIA